MLKRYFSLKPKILLLVFLIVFLVSAVIISPATAAFSNYEKEAAEINLERLQEKYGLKELDDDHELSIILADLQEIVQQEHTDLEFTLHYADTDVVNGLYIGDGNIILFAGLVDILSRDERAALIGHEMGHGVEGHLDANLRRNIGFGLGRLLLDRLLGQNASSSRFYQIFVNLTIQLMDRGFSREQEKEADIFAVDLLSSSQKYQASGMIGLLEVIQDMQGRRAPELLELFNTHPSPETRLEYTRERIKELEAKDNFRISK